jgi:hypothetical protein
VSDAIEAVVLQLKHGERGYIVHNREQLDDMAASEFAMLKIKRLQMLQLDQRRAEFEAGIVT